MLLLAAIAVLLALAVVALPRTGLLGGRARPAGAADPGPALAGSAGERPAGAAAAGRPAPGAAGASVAARPAAGSAGGASVAGQGGAGGRPAPSAGAADPGPSVAGTAGAAPGSPVPVAVAARTLPEKVPARLALVFDDAGHNLADLRPYLSLPVPLAVAVLPRLAHSADAARAVREAGKELLLHAPMEPLNGENPGPGAITTAQDADEIRALLEGALAEVQGACGVNNHMGSKATADERVMADLMRVLQGSGRLFLDSRTTAASVAGPAAARFGVPFLSRDVFLDNEHDEAEVQREIRRGVAIARKGKGAVLIGHVTSPVSAVVIARMLAELQRDGVRFVRLAELLREREESHAGSGN